jgi:hypothetical protein
MVRQLSPQEQLGEDLEGLLQVHLDSDNGFTAGSVAYWESFKQEMWRFQISGQVIAKPIPNPVEIRRCEKVRVFLLASCRCSMISMVP